MYKFAYGNERIDVSGKGKIVGRLDANYGLCFYEDHLSTKRL